MSPFGLSCDLARLLCRLRDCDTVFTHFTPRTASVLIVARGRQANATLVNATLGGNLPTCVEDTGSGQRWIIGWPNSSACLPPDAFERFTHFGMCLAWWLAEDHRLATNDADRLIRHWKGAPLATWRKRRRRTRQTAR
jgi:hypothetical protein